MSQVGPLSLTLTEAESDSVWIRKTEKSVVWLLSCVKIDGSMSSVISVYKQINVHTVSWSRQCVWRTELSKVEARAGGGGEAGAGGERGVTSRVLQPAGGVGAQPIAALLMASQLWGRPISTKTQR